MQNATAERRTAARFQVGLPVVMDGHECGLRQLSPRGLLLDASVPPTVGKEVSLELRYEAEDGARSTVAVAGYVLRVQLQDKAFLVAVQLHEPLF